MPAHHAPWQRTLTAFAGRGIAQPSEMMRVSDDEAAAILATLSGVDWLLPTYMGQGRSEEYRVANATKPATSGLFHGDRVVGFYVASYLWIDRAHRGRGLAVPLILTAACQRGGTVVPPGVVLQGYTRGGVAAHRAAHGHAVRRALAAGLPVPPAVRAEVLAGKGTGHPGRRLTGPGPDAAAPSPFDSPFRRPAA